MRKIIITTITIILIASIASPQVPATVHAQWSPNPAADNVTQYQTTLDANSSVTTLPAACSPTLCSQILTVSAFGLHTVTVVAQNLKFANDPTTLQSGPPLSVTFTLAAAPVVVSGLRVVN